MRSRLASAIGVACILCIIACSPRPTAVPSPEAAPPGPRSLILVIIDGFGVQQLGLVEDFARKAETSTFSSGSPTAFRELIALGKLGLSLPTPRHSLTVESAGSATRLALGADSLHGGVGMRTNGAAGVSILEALSERGFRTGVISDARITHATPAAFYAHREKRHDENAIALDAVASPLDLLLGGGARHFVAATGSAAIPGVSSAREDSLAPLITARERGFAVAFDAKTLEAAPDGRLLGLFAPSGLDTAIQIARREASSPPSQPSLAELARSGMARLSKDGHPFALMIEAAQVDWAGHANDAAWMLRELLKAEAMLREVHQFALSHPETLIVVTGDHETGGFGFNYVRENDELNFGTPELLDLLLGQQETLEGMVSNYRATSPSAEALATVLSASTGFAVEAPEAVALLAPGAENDTVLRDRIGRFLDRRYQVVWATHNHTSSPVPLITVGPGSENFPAMTDHSTVGELLWTMLQAR